MVEIDLLVVYDSRTGNTEKMAHDVAEGAKEIEGTVVVLKKVDRTTIEDLLKADAIIMGSPTYYGQMSAKVKELIDKSVKVHGKLSGKVGAAFTSAGGISTGAESAILSIVQTMLIHGMVVQGRADDQHYGVACKGAPDKEALKLCRELGKRTAELARKIYRK